MSAERLREAARLMRERAEVATGGDWSDGGVWWEHWTDPAGLRGHTPWPTVTTGHVGSEIVAKARTEADSAHIASWPPAVALAVADWLDEVAERQKPTWHWGRRSHGWTGSKVANALADAYLGDPS